MKEKIFLLLLILSQYALGQRSETILNTGWLFTSEDVAGAYHPDCDVSLWKNIDLPYDYSMEEGN